MRTPLGEKLKQLRQRYIGGGGKLLSEEEIDRLLIVGETQEDTEMMLDQAIRTFYDAVKSAMASDDMVTELLKSSGELFDAAKTIITFAIDLMQGKRESVATNNDGAARQLYSLLADATDAPQAALDPAEALGPMAWIAIARMIFEILTRLKGRNK